MRENKLITMRSTEETKQNYTGIGIYNDNESHRNYIGDYVDGNEHGIGMYEARIRNKIPLHKYAGQFNNNKAEGIGVKSYSNGKEIYCGGYKNNERNGLGYWKLPSGAIFVGEHKDHGPNGFGMMITWEGFKFIGYVDNWRAQSGKWYDQKDNEIDITKLGYNKDGSKYVGGYKDGKRHGQGTITHPDGRKYVGEFKDNKIHGQGSFTFSNGQKYVGEYKDGEQHGQGTSTWPDGDEYIGEYKDGKRHGQGTNIRPSGAKYVGEYKNGKSHGQGTYTYPDGAKYVGEYKDGKFIG
mgnify:CR=1 FL=1|tara:strand:+ start:950 stop:1834 length:885 start_codon:yes stop_codon:yes gene_type:complete